MENSKFSDGIISEIKNGDYGNFDVLLEQYRPLIESAVSRYRGSQDADDIRQLAFIALFSAVRSFDPSSGVSLGYYAKICINNAIRSEMRRSINERFDEYDESSDPSASVAGPEDELILREDFESVLDEIGSFLTKYEFEVLKLYLMGYPYKSIAEKLGRDEISVGNALARTKNKIKNHRFGK